ncbi:LamG-like jellyroll fold domain-containing protein [Algibacter mikhailovii]|uniref:LamG-like jellyroll fold domain-containing protein n=1 Tax=Algibacter mikhailovii TaxID=425498 RepID=A0A918QVC7_9FLAO|nr:LamG-like jellyroll fold domain-containing protein [Algibacter mikhailovii]GGZ75054.1 hypothetical protein GCM10007028_10590 [Algibacter mikhailovii]
MKKITFLTLIMMSFNLAIAQTALDFDPDRGLQQVQISDITCPSEFTFELWINYKGQRSGEFYPTLIEFGDDTPFFGFESGFLTLFGGVKMSTRFPTNQWIHVAVTYSTVDSSVALYVNGELEAAAIGVVIDISGVGAGIGNNGSDDVFNGYIDDVRIWDIARSRSEILSDMNTCLTGTETNLYAFYNFDEGTGTVVNDLTGNNFNGTLVNMDPVTAWIPYDSCNSLSIENQNTNLQISLFPNPSSDFVSISGLKTKTNYEVYNAIGSKVLKGTLAINDKIDVQNLTSGIYLLKLESGSALKFIKE